MNNNDVKDYSILPETYIRRICLFTLLLTFVLWYNIRNRDNSMHSNTAHGATCSAALYSIVATAQANGLDTEKYLTELFSQPAGTVIMPWKNKEEIV